MASAATLHELVEHTLTRSWGSASRNGNWFFRELGFFCHFEIGPFPSKSITLYQTLLMVCSAQFLQDMQVRCNPSQLAAYKKAPCLPQAQRPHQPPLYFPHPPCHPHNLHPKGGSKEVILTGFRQSMLPFSPEILVHEAGELVHDIRYLCSINEILLVVWGCEPTTQGYTICNFLQPIQSNPIMSNS